MDGGGLARLFCGMNPRPAPLASHAGLSARIRYGRLDDVLDQLEAEAVCRRAVVAAVAAGEDEDTAKRRLAAHPFGRAVTRLLYPEQGTFPGAASYQTPWTMTGPPLARSGR